MWHWLAHWMGLLNAGGPIYSFWSGIGSDVGELTLVVGVISLLRHNNCEVKPCWRLGRHKTAAGHKVCRRHHPDGHLTAEIVAKAHSDAHCLHSASQPAIVDGDGPKWSSKDYEG